MVEGGRRSMAMAMAMMMDDAAASRF